MGGRTGLKGFGEWDVKKESILAAGKAAEGVLWC
jgi:hypothetical protein